MHVDPDAVSAEPFASGRYASGGRGASPGHSLASIPVTRAEGSERSPPASSRGSAGTRMPPTRGPVAGPSWGSTSDGGEGGAAAPS